MVEALRAARANLRRLVRPLLAVQVGAFALVAAYYLFPGFAAAVAPLGAWKVRGGFAFSAVSNVVASLVLPELARRLTRHHGGSPRGANLLFQVGFFALIGMNVDLLYRVLTLLFGTGTDPLTIARKAAFDQFVVSPFLTMPFSVLAFLWRDAGFSLRATRVALREGEFLRRYGPAMLSCWAFWVPVLFAVFALPTSLQFPLFLCAQAAWSLILVGLSER